MITLLLAATVSAHDAGECPPIPMMQSMARRGRLDPRMTDCLKHVSEPENAVRGAAWALWRNAMARDPSSAETAAQFVGLGLTDANLALESAELLQDTHADTARAALNVAAEHASQWKSLGVRTERLMRWGRVLAALEPETGPLVWARGLSALGVVGDDLKEARGRCEALAEAAVCASPESFPVAAASPPEADDLVSCGSSAHLWSRMVLSPVYTTERDCLVRAVARMPAGPGRDRAVRLGAVLALRHDATEVSGVVLRALWGYNPGDPLVAAAGVKVHTEHEDAVGAAWWEGQRDKGTPPESE